VLSYFIKNVCFKYPQIFFKKCRFLTTNMHIFISDLQYKSTSVLSDILKRKWPNPCSMINYTPESGGIPL